MKCFLGDNVNAIEIQIWVTVIAYLLLRVMQTKSMSKLAFSNIVMLTRVTLGAYIDIITLLNCPKLDWNLLETIGPFRHSGGVTFGYENIIYLFKGIF